MFGLRKLVLGGWGKEWQVCSELSVTMCKRGLFTEELEFIHSMLMMYANAGNLDTYISHRRSSSKHLSLDPTPNDPPTPLSRDEQIESKDSESYMPTAEELKRRFRQRKASMRAGMGREEVFGESRGVMLLSREDLASLFGDIVAGLAFLVSSRGVGE